MADDFRSSQLKSASAFKSLIAPKLALVLKGDFSIVEGSPVEMDRKLDTIAGIDLWHIHTEQGIRGVASRIQFSDKCYRTFTIRKSRESGAKTEFEKRSKAIETGHLYPHLTLQAYVSKENGSLFGFAVCHTVQLIEIIQRRIRSDESGQRHPELSGVTSKLTGSDQLGQAWFWVVPWRSMIESGMKVYVHDTTTNQFAQGRLFGVSPYEPSNTNSVSAREPHYHPPRINGFVYPRSRDDGPGART